MTDKQIFNYLFKLARTSKDPEGVVAAALVRAGKILLSTPCADNSIRHAEDLVIEAAQKQGIQIDDKVILYSTLEPCSTRNKAMSDCTSLIIQAGIKAIIFAAQDPEYSQKARKRCHTAGISYQQVKNQAIIQQAVDLFNSTSIKPLDTWQLPRQNRLT